MFVEVPAKGWAAEKVQVMRLNLAVVKFDLAVVELNLAVHLEWAKVKRLGTEWDPA